MLDPEFLVNNLFFSALSKRPSWQAGEAAVERYRELGAWSESYISCP